MERRNALLKSQIEDKTDPKWSIENILSNKTSQMKKVFLCEKTEAITLPSMINSRVVSIVNHLKVYQNYKEPKSLLDKLEPVMFQDAIDESKVSELENKIQSYSDVLMNKQKDFTNNYESVVDVDTIITEHFNHIILVIKKEEEDLINKSRIDDYNVTKL